MLELNPFTPGYSQLLLFGWFWKLDIINYHWMNLSNEMNFFTKQLSEFHDNWKGGLLNYQTSFVLLCTFFRFMLNLMMELYWVQRL